MMRSDICSLPDHDLVRFKWHGYSGSTIKGRRDSLLQRSGQLVRSRISHSPGVRRFQTDLSRILRASCRCWIVSGSLPGWMNWRVMLESFAGSFHKGRINRPAGLGTPPWAKRWTNERRDAVSAVRDEATAGGKVCALRNIIDQLAIVLHLSRS